MAILAVIPARYGSTRFPGKPLALLGGKPMIQRVYERVAQAKKVDRVVVATDDEKIRELAQRVGAAVTMTSPLCRSGTERCAQAAREQDAAIIINVQGDEPFIRSEMVDQVAVFLENHPAVPMASLRTPLHRVEDRNNPHVVKVVVDRDGFALYFSRAPIPFVPEGAWGLGLGAGESYPVIGPRPSTVSHTVEQDSGGRDVTPIGVGMQVPQAYPVGPSASIFVPQLFKHIGLYGYQRDFLLRLPHLVPTPLEQLEQLEQLRALEHGYRIKLLETAYDTIGIDTPEDLARAEALLAAAEPQG